MKKLFILFILIGFLIANIALADDVYSQKFPSKPIYSERKKIENMLIERLKLSNEQVSSMRDIHNSNKKEMEKIISEMKCEHDKIRKVYLSGIPQYQIYFRTAPSKAKLVVLKQHADILRDENRKKFEALLNEEQKIEFEKIKLEFAKKRNFNQHHHHE